MDKNRKIMDYSRIFGWILLILGVGIIGWTMLSSYNIFTGKAIAPEVFELPKEEIKIQQKQRPPERIRGIEDIQAQMQAQMQAQIEQMLGEQLKEILPVDTLPKLLNLVVWSILAGVLFFGGGQISNLGIKLIKK